MVNIKADIKFAEEHCKGLCLIFALLLSFSCNNGTPIKTFSDKNISIVFPCKYKSKKESFGRLGNTVTYSCYKDDFNYSLSIVTIFDPSRKNAKIALRGGLKA